MSLSEKSDFIVESYQTTLNRYTGFGKDIYLRIKQELPLVFDGLIFYQWTKHQTEDSYAEYTNGSVSFVIQLDPDIELIILWNNNFHIEIGTWSDNAYDEAIAFIKLNLLKL